MATKKGGSKSRLRTGGNALSTAAVPFGLFTLSNYLSGRKRRHRTKKRMRRKTARRAYMKKK